MTFQEIRIIATGPCMANQLRDVSTICKRSWYIAAHIWKIYDFKIEIVPFIINVSTELIDHNPTATTATTSFHGTSISLFQHLSTDNEGEKRESIRIKDSKIKRVPELPDSFTNIHPAFFTKKNPIPSKVNIPLNLDTNNIKIDLTV
jgi:hypothetical protein